MIVLIMIFNFSCSQESSEVESNENVEDNSNSEVDDSDNGDDVEIIFEVEAIAPNYGYKGDEITLILNTNIPANSKVDVFIGNNKAAIKEINGTNITFILPDNEMNYSHSLFINDVEVAGFNYFYYQNQLFDCTDCYEQVYDFEDDEAESGIGDVYENDEEQSFYLSVARNNNYDYKTYLVETDKYLKKVSKTLLFDSKLISKAIFEADRFVVSNSEGVFAFDYTGSMIWSYETEIIDAGMTSTYIGYTKKSVLKHNGFYYVIKNAQENYPTTPSQIEVVKLNSNGQFVNSIYIPNAKGGQDPVTYENAQTANEIFLLDNKIVVTFNYCCLGDHNSQGGHAIIDDYDNIVFNSENETQINSTNVFVQDDAFYFFRNIYGSTFELVKIVMDSENYFQIEFTRNLEGGLIEYYNGKYFIYVHEVGLLVFGDNSFSNPSFFIPDSIENENYDGLFVDLKVINNHLYLFGQRTIGGAIIYKDLLGKFDLDYLLSQ
ncbi:MAG: hypothetical protein GYB37_04800 [Algicola sp.]|nr:hypothetical protein [Algicola sp.]